jgi:hypothetical protein
MVVVLLTVVIDDSPPAEEEYPPGYIGEAGVGLASVTGQIVVYRLMVSVVTCSDVPEVMV